MEKDLHMLIDGIDGGSHTQYFERWANHLFIGNQIFTGDTLIGAYHQPTL